MYLILSKDTAKFSYETRPCAIWSETKKAYICPVCGQVLTKRVSTKVNGRKTMIEVPLEKLDMLKPLSINKSCKNKVIKYNNKTHKDEEVVCNTSLWAPLNKEDSNLNWVKLGSTGWILKKHINEIYEELINKDTLIRKESILLEKLSDVKDILDNDEEIKGIKAPRKYSIAKYIRERFKGKIDYFISDELHLYKSNSLQGQAMADIFSASKYFIGLTGTLLNGYASGLFYILYRTLPQLMKQEGFKYTDEMEFMRQYGVIETNNRYSISRDSTENKISSGNEKPLPGVSPLLFTKFLLENAVFISLSDMDGGLPGYEEIPLGIDMDNELKEAYNTLESDLRRAMARRGEGGIKIMGSFLQALSVYPDMPYNQPEIIHPDTQEILVTPPELHEGLRNKENELLKLVKEKVENKEKVLIYYEWTNKTDVAKKLTDMFNENNIKSVVLTSSVKSELREEWIDNQLEKGIDVLICNPSLVETGLDLLSFTNIIFYQVGYNIFTMRQASRRSWRLSQDKDIKVYFMYYKDTIQAQALSLMATKLQASMAIEGKFSEEGLRAMSNNENLLTQIANSVVEGIKDVVEINTFSSVQKTERKIKSTHKRIPLSQLLNITINSILLSSSLLSTNNTQQLNKINKEIKTTTTINSLMNLTTVV